MISDLIDGYMFCCASCGNTLPIRYAGSAINKFIKCRTCADKIHTCKFCGVNYAACDVSPLKEVCADCYSDDWCDVGGDMDTEDDDD